jgi:hypothetical protein
MIYFMLQIINRMKHVLCCIALDGSVQHLFLAVKKVRDHFRLTNQKRLGTPTHNMSGCG